MGHLKYFKINRDNIGTDFNYVKTNNVEILIELTETNSNYCFIITHDLLRECYVFLKQQYKFIIIYCLYFKTH